MKDDNNPNRALFQKVYRKVKSNALLDEVSFEIDSHHLRNPMISHVDDFKNSLVSFEKEDLYYFEEAVLDILHQEGVEYTRDEYGSIFVEGYLLMFLDKDFGEVSVWNF